MAQCTATVITRDPWQLPPNTSKGTCSFKAVGTFNGERLCSRHFKIRTEDHVRAQCNSLDGRIKALRAQGASKAEIEKAFAERDAFDYAAALAKAQRGKF